MLDLTNPQIVRFIEDALKEDIGRGDITTALTVPRDQHCLAEIRAKSSLVLAGVEFAAGAFWLVDGDLEFAAFAEDGARIKKGGVIATICGPTASVLTAEHVALNILQRLSGVATLTAKYVDAIKGTKARILDTRKTTPGMRLMQKHAVLMGGGHSHRFGLDDGILIKDNHIEAAGSITNAVRAARKGSQPVLKIEVECEDMEQVQEALKAKADIIMLDNMSAPMVKKCVTLIKGRALTEASGNVTPQRARELARAGVDFISVGALTHSAPSADISLDIRID